MYAGRIVEQGTLDEIFYDPQHPYTWGLLGSITRVDRAAPASACRRSRACRRRCSTGRRAATSGRAARTSSTSAREVPALEARDRDARRTSTAAGCRSTRSAPSARSPTGQIGLAATRRIA